MMEACICFKWTAPQFAFAPTQKQDKPNTIGADGVSGALSWRLRASTLQWRWNSPSVDIMSHRRLTGRQSGMTEYYYWFLFVGRGGGDSMLAIITKSRLSFFWLDIVWISEILSNYKCLQPVCVCRQRPCVATHPFWLTSYGTINKTASHFTDEHPMGHDLFEMFL